MLAVVPFILLCVAMIVLGASLANRIGWVVLALAVAALLFAVIPHFPH